MRMFRAVLAFTLLLSMVAAGSAAAPASAERSTYIVVLDDSVADVQATARTLARGVGGDLGFVYQHALKGFSAELTAQAASALTRNPTVRSVSPNGVVHMAEDSVPTGVSRIDAPISSQTGSGVRVAIIDTGIDLDHPDLAPNIAAGSGKNCIDPGASTDDDQGHGTHVAGTVAAADNGAGLVGVAPGATLIPVKVLNSQGSGSWDQVICGIDHVAGLGNVDVANMSLGGSGTASGDCTKVDGEFNTTDPLYAAICGALDAGVTVVVAAGNDAKNASGFVPAAYPEVITVSAYTDLDGTAGDSGCTGGRGPFRSCDETFASFSNYGSVVDVIAPGVNILSTTMGGGTGTKSGTSMASPHVAGVAALILGANPTLSPADVAAHLRNTGQCPNDLINANTGGTCSGQGTWTNDKDTITEPMANAAFALGTTADEPTDPPPTDGSTYTVILNGSASSPGGSQWTAEVFIDVEPHASVAYEWSNGVTGTCDGDCPVSQTLHKRVSSITLTITLVADGTDFGGETQVTVFKP